MVLVYDTEELFLLWFGTVTLLIENIFSGRVLDLGPGRNQDIATTRSTINMAEEDGKNDVQTVVTVISRKSDVIAN